MLFAGFKALFADTTGKKTKSQSFSYTDDSCSRNDYTGSSTYYPLSATSNIRYVLQLKASNVLISNEKKNCGLFDSLVLLGKKNYQGATPPQN